MKVLSEFKNELLKRNEVVVKSDYKSNPGLKKVIEDLAGKFGVSEEVVTVRKLSGSFGSDEFVIDFFIYDSLGDRESIERKRKEKKK